jgi:phospholipase C
MQIQEKIKYVIVLMLENRSFDHLCGYLRQSNADIDGILQTEFNLMNPSDTNSERVGVSDSAPFVPDLNPGPGHNVRDVKIQLDPRGGGTLTMDGFVYDYAQQTGVTELDAKRVMQCFSPAKLPVITTLSRQFVLCDRWHSSLPGPTWPNRLFVHCATSGGFVDNNPHEFAMLQSLKI